MFVTIKRKTNVTPKIASATCSSNGITFGKYAGCDFFSSHPHVTILIDKDKKVILFTDPSDDPSEVFAVHAQKSGQRSIQSKDVISDIRDAFRIPDGYKGLFSVDENEDGVVLTFEGVMQMSVRANG